MKLKTNQKYFSSAKTKKVFRFLPTCEAALDVALKSNFVNISKQPKTPTLSCQSSSHGFVVEKMGGNAFLRKSIGCLTLGILRIAEDRIYIFYESWCIIGIIEHCDEIQTWGRYRIRIAIKTCFCGKRDKREREIARNEKDKWVQLNKRQNIDLKKSLI